MPDTPILILLVILVPIAPLVLMFWLWPRKGRMGINTKTVHCPRCHTKAPLMRVPKNSRQLMWGGWTCKKCECEFDKYGKEIEKDQ